MEFDIIYERYVRCDELLREIRSILTSERIPFKCNMDAVIKYHLKKKGCYKFYGNYKYLFTYKNNMLKVIKINLFNI